MISSIIQFSLKNKLTILLITTAIVLFGLYALSQIPIGAVPDVTNNQVQIITTSRNLSTQDVEQFITYPVELEMANLPGVKEIRSISKFGLSVVTIVFDDDLGTYLPRQLIAEKIKSASANIPEGFGSPTMGPITTGLGEIYQYILDVDSAHRDQYTTMDLRTIQDWVVKRQLSGIPGVVEVNTWGGFLKQYEVMLNPSRLKAMDISLAEVFTALEKNNSVAGGGYIEKDDEAYFIRGEGLTTSISDIENIVVDNREGVPIFIRDIGEVNFGFATRFGAITANAEGEKVLGQVMMLKNANSKAVIEAVKERVAEVQESLPAGVYINPFLERSELIAKTTFTIGENLLFGCLIVVFVVVLLLGNLRTGLIVGSIIPLCLLFAISMMYLFGVDANLMSLGAIDFGIIIDGAVIIVEYIAFKITADQLATNLNASERQQKIDSITLSSTKKMMHSAVFGQLIIIIVFIPILSLSDIEGKMFRPMALTFCFALVGAMFLCFTYVPVMASLFLNPENAQPGKFTVRLLNGLRNTYENTLKRALTIPKIVIATAALLLAGSIYIFNSLGGEFIPTLDEGDFVIQPVIKTGTSLGKTVELTTQMESLILTFPEVDQVATRIGAAEVPTDPMSMEESDVIITLHPIKEWESGYTKDELAEAIKNKLLNNIPDVDYEFTQPIEMRFNELITGVRADLAIKIFGEDLNILADKAREIEQLVQDVEGASDVVVEKVEGLPQMRVDYNRAKIARYGLNVEDVNQIISMGFAGKTAGSVFEGERRFELVVRFHSDYRKNLNSLKNSTVTTPAGIQVPLKELADISYDTGPAKISRDNTRRRIVVSINVRDRDLESVVDDARNLINNNIDLPVGYYVTYGGQFENLENARQRLMVAVPVALLLIFIMLYFAFRSIRDALMIYTAIPLSAVGGVLLLWLRDMPFSISAGVGFIALFGIAVLNGIVLIEHYKSNDVSHDPNFIPALIKSTITRLRPVLLTASAAALGFLPMALSTSAGAEVQRPLATVVIGGLITSTLLTLLVLPVLYYMINKNKMKGTKTKVLAVLLVLVSAPLWTNAQEPLTLEKAIQLARENNRQLQSGEMAVEQQQSLKGTALNFEKSTLYYSYDEANIAPNNTPLRVWGVQQNFAFPTVYGQRAKLNQKRVDVVSSEYKLTEWIVDEQVTRSYYQVVYQQNLNAEYAYLDSVYGRFARAAQRRFELGETNVLEKLTAETRQNEIHLELQKGQKALEQAYGQLNQWIQTDGNWSIPTTALTKLELRALDSLNHPLAQIYSNRYEVAKQEEKVARSGALPDLQLVYFQGTNSAENAEVFQGFQVGLGIPIIFGSQKSKVRTSAIQQDRIALEKENYEIQLASRHNQLLLELEKHEEALNNYERTGEVLSSSLIRAANRSYQNGEIDFLQYVQILDKGVQLRVNYLKDLHLYNQTVIDINYIKN